MLNIKYIKNIFLLILLALFIQACESTDDKQTLKEIAITLISNYADGKGPIPTIRNYEDAGIVGVNEQNLNELNLFISTLVAEDIDTEEELNAVVDALGISLDSDIVGPVITIYGANPLTIEEGSTYTEPVVTAIDGRDGEVTVYCEGEVDTNRVGTYIIKHSAVDEAGNLVTVERIVYVVEITNPGIPDDTLFSIGGDATGLAGTVVLQNSNGDNLNINAEGSFVFGTQVPDMSTYSISILSTPATQNCSLTNAIGTVSGVNVTNVVLTCSTLHPVQYYISIAIDVESDSGFTFELANIINNDFISVHDSGEIPQIETFSQPLVANENYIINLSNLGKNTVDCFFTDTTSTSISGSISNADVTIPVTCFYGY